MQHFKDLLVWQKSHLFALDIYTYTKKFPKEELYGIISQIRRLATSVPTNIAEGAARYTDADTVKFYQIAVSSLQETEYLILLSKDFGYLSESEYKILNSKIVESKLMLLALISKIRQLIKS
jgi:four helix bundle protein